jgi:hypothetical protein
MGASGASGSAVSGVAGSGATGTTAPQPTSGSAGAGAEAGLASGAPGAAPTRTLATTAGLPTSGGGTGASVSGTGANGTGAGAPSTGSLGAVNRATGQAVEGGGDIELTPIGGGSTVTASPGESVTLAPGTYQAEMPNPAAGYTASGPVYFEVPEGGEFEVEIPLTEGGAAPSERNTTAREPLAGVPSGRVR